MKWLQEGIIYLYAIFQINILEKKTLRMTEVPLRCSIKWVVVSSNAVENVQHKRNKKETSLKGQVTFLKLCMYVGCVHCTDHS